ncbi:MAG: sulfate adenylyltransferase subunit CysN [Rhizobiaceae bacterium]
MLSQQHDAPVAENPAAGPDLLPNPQAAAPSRLNSKALRFITCGSVDDGKSTLIGRLLWDTKSVSSDHADGLANSSVQSDEETGTHIPEFALLLDGLQAEREQGITIDVAYRYFSTANRSFIVADTPGHEQYTRNMATGCSTADLAVVLVDARTGILEQTRRHATIATLMGIRQLVLVVNKMDLVDYSQSIFQSIASQFIDLADSLEANSVTAIPVSALRGHNVVSVGSARMPWYQGPTLLQAIETAPAAARQDRGFRFPVQRVSRPDESFRGYQGTIAGGSAQVGQKLTVWPGGATAKIQRIHTFDGDVPMAQAGDAVTLVLDRDVDIARGDLLTSSDQPPLSGRRFNAEVVALDPAGLEAGRQYWLKSATRRLRVRLDPETRLDLQSGDWRQVDQLEVNGIGRIKVQFEEDATFDLYKENQTTGSFVLIHPRTNNTIAAGMVTGVLSGAGGQQKSASTQMMQLTLPADLARKLLDSEMAADYREQIRTQLVPVSE